MSRHRKASEVDAPHFGEWLRQLRVLKDLPLRTVAAAADMDMTLLSKVELGQRLVTEEQTAKLAEFFGVNRTEAQARRMVEKFRQESEVNPEAAREAVYMLAERAGISRRGATETRGASASAANDQKPNSKYQGNSAVNRAKK